MRQGGFEWSIGTMLALVLLVTAGIFLAAYISGGGEFIQGFLKDLCDKYPQLPFCPKIAEPYETLGAETSVRALQCAVNSVALGEHWSGCSNKVKFTSVSDQATESKSKWLLCDRGENRRVGLERYYCLQKTQYAYCAGGEIGMYNSEQECNSKIDYLEAGGTISEVTWLLCDRGEEFPQRDVSRYFCKQKNQYFQACPGNREVGRYDSQEECESNAPSEEFENVSVECYCSYPEIEYNSDRKPGTGRTGNLKFKYENGEWKWESEDLGFDIYGLIRDGFEIQGRNILDEIDPVYEEIILNENTGLTVYYNDFDKGIEIFQNAVKSDVSGHDDEIKVGSTTLNKDNIDTLPDEAKPFCSCKVKHFQLPQEVTKAEDWILYYGDPQFLVYWQDFPVEWDTWTYEFDLKMQLAIIAITAFPPLKVSGALVRTGITSVKYLVRNVPKGLYKHMVKKQLKKNMAKAMIGRFKEAPLKFLLGKSAKFAGMEASAILLELAESIQNKYESHGNSIVLKSPYDKFLTEQTGKEFTLVDEWEGKPVLITWDPGTLTGRRTVHAHLVSPCKAKELKVEKRDVICDNYFFDPAKKISRCGKDISKADEFWSEIAGFLGADDKPYCDISTYLGVNHTYVNDMNTISSKPIMEVIDNLKKVQDYELSENIIIDKGDDGVEEKWDVGIRETFPIDPDTGELDMPNKIRIKYSGREQMLEDSDDNGYFDSFGLKDCTIEAILLDLDTSEKNMPEDGNNYCVDNRGTGRKILAWGGVAVGTVGSVVGLLVPGLRWVIIASAIAGVSAEAAAAYQTYEGQWPG